jgi:hypothetical protein
MKPLKLALRIWFTIVSVLSFLVGWALLSHSPKPASIFSPQSDGSSLFDPSTGSDNLPTLAPIPSIDTLINNSSSTSNIQPLPSFNNSAPTINNGVQRPRLRTRGS